jgi:HTH-type transcriptional regulator/antitoxin HigA
MKENSQVKTPGEYIREELQKRGWTQPDLAKILARPLPTVNEIIQGKRAIMPEMAVALGEAFETGAEIWMHREASYRLSLVKEGGTLVRKRARLFDLAPIKDMQKRGWIKMTDDVTELESELCRFFEVGSIDQEPNIVADFKKTMPDEVLTPLQKVWYFRAKQVASAVQVKQFAEDRLPLCEKELVKLAGFPQEARKVAAVLSSFGIRFVIVEPLAGSKLDGAAFWLDPVSPVIVLSLRFDRIDAFWFHLGHEFSHIKNKDSLSIDSNLFGQDKIPSNSKTLIEQRADIESAAMLIPPQQMESFVKRVAPMYSKERINQFANKVKIHPGIIVGQLQHRDEIGFHANREMLVKIRNIVVPSSVTDGWGETINTKVFE